MAVRRGVEVERKPGGTCGRDVAAVAGRSLARWTGAERREAVTSKRSPRAGISGDFSETGPVPHPFPQRRPPVSSPISFPSSLLPTGAFLRAPPPRFLVWRDAISRRDGALRGRPREPPPRSPLQPGCPAPATFPGSSMCSLGGLFRVSPSYLPVVTALLLRAAFHSSIYSFSYALVPSANVPDSFRRSQAPYWTLGTRR